MRCDGKGRAREYFGALPPTDVTASVEIVPITLNYFKASNVIIDNEDGQARERDDRGKTVSKMTLGLILDSLTLDYRMLTSGVDITSRQASLVD